MAFRKIAAGLALAGLALQAQAQETRYFFVFGDSYSSTGFDIAGEKPSAANPFGNPALPGNTQSGGHTWVGYLATSYNSTLVLTYNFARVYATVDNAVIPAMVPDIPSISDQIKTWKDNVGPKPDYAPWKSDDSLFSVFVGTNDIGNTFGEPATMEAKLNAAQDRLFVNLGSLYDAGARKFLLVKVPPTNLTPLMKSIGETTTQAGIAFWNDQLQSRIDNFKGTKEGVDVTLADPWRAWAGAVGYPPVWGAEDATCVVCPGAPDQTCGLVEEQTCLWYNSYHPGTAIHLQMANEVSEKLEGWM